MTAPAAPLRGRKILVAKPGLDGHDVGAKVITLALCDAGAEVIYTGLRRSPGHIVQAAVDEDVDAVGLSILSGGHVELVRAVVQGLQARNVTDVQLFVGGTIPLADRGALRELGVKAIFSAADPLEVVIAEIARSLGQERK